MVNIFENREWKYLKITPKLKNKQPLTINSKLNVRITI